jgi:hypothetical protein
MRIFSKEQPINGAKKHKMVWGRQLCRDKNNIKFYQHSNNDQKDELVLPFMQRLLGENFDLWPKSVCFNGEGQKRAWRKVKQIGCSNLMTKTASCLETFHSRSLKFQPKPHVALVEGLVGWLGPLTPNFFFSF